MKFVLFYHSLVSDWNHGNAHFLRGMASELLARGHEVDIYEPADGWSLRMLMTEQGKTALAEFQRVYPNLVSHRYQLASLDLDHALDDADVVIVHEWNEPELIRRVGQQAAHSRFHLFFHDTHHRSVTEPRAMEGLDLRHYDGVLAFGKIIADCYLRKGWAQSAWVWHEAADTRRFYPQVRKRAGDLVWIGNWGDGERSAELHEFLIEPVAMLGLKAKMFGVRYPVEVQRELRSAGIKYGGWLPNFAAPETFAAYGCTVHVPRRPYAQALRGIPTIRMFEALACGIPLVCAPWDDAEHLFRPGIDYLVARDGARMSEHLRALRSDPSLAKGIAASGLQTILERHTCKHRVDELLDIVAHLGHVGPVLQSQAPMALVEGQL